MGMRPVSFITDKRFGVIYFVAHGSITLRKVPDKYDFTLNAMF